MEQKNRQSACALYEFMIDHHLDDHEKIKTWCRKWGKHWVFQLEKGTERGNLHYQGLISLKGKTRLDTLKKDLRKDGELAMIRHIAPCSNTGIKGGDVEFYVTKPQREAGPWSDKDRIVFFSRGIERFKNMDNLLPWQQTIYDQKDEFQLRTVNMIVDPQGGKGKSTFAKLMLSHGYAICLPCCGDAKDMTQALTTRLSKTNNRDPGMIIIDMKRSSNQTNHHGLYDAIEQIKDGIISDFRYSWTEWLFHEPQVWVFCNRMPDTGMLTKSRWKFWEINPMKQLVKLRIPHVTHDQNIPNGNSNSSGAALSLHDELPNRSNNFRPLEPLEPVVGAFGLDNPYHQEDEYDMRNMLCASEDSLMREIDLDL